MENVNVRIGYVPYSEDLAHPDDRRRFPFYAKRQNISYSLAKYGTHYDIVILPAPANLTRWWEYRKTHPDTVFIFEMVDSLIHQNDWINILMKGLGRYLLHKESKPSLIHKNVLIRWLKFADVVLCSNPVTVEVVKNWNNNVIFSLDYQEHEYQFLKKDFSIKGKMKLFWEGQGVILPQLLQYKKVFKKVRPFCELHIVTSGSFPLHDPFYRIKTKDFLRRLPIESFFHQWDQANNPDLFSGFDCGIIPISSRDIYAWHKPANKLIAFWFSGIPTLTSDTPAYRELALKSGSDFLCRNEEEWVEKLERTYRMTPEQRRSLAEENYRFVKKMYSNEEMDKSWEEILKIGINILQEKRDRTT
ncbi:MAG: glycosyltransferase family 1 protein [Chitinophagaceae bacterium]|nr:glycosyltransferase family 1 protein [Chitinophagaceae bacterium]